MQLAGLCHTRVPYIVCACARYSAGGSKRQATGHSQPKPADPAASEMAEAEHFKQVLLSALMHKVGPEAGGAGAGMGMIPTPMMPPSGMVRISALQPTPSGGTQPSRSSMLSSKSSGQVVSLYIWLSPTTRSLGHL